jgi:hypothetical protein
MVRRMRGANREGKRMGGIFSKLGKTLATVFIVGSLSSFLSNVINIRAEFEKYEAVLTNTFQSAEAGQTAMNMIKDFAAKTPFQLNQLTGAYVKLVNRGFIPTEKNMTSLGDLAASQGKSFDQLTEAILDAETAEFERLKEFGIKASKAGNKVTFAFKGVKKTVDANSTSIRKAILGFGDMEGVTGSMAAISKTLGGRLSNLKDKWDNLLNSIGQNSGGVFASVIEGLGKGIDFLQRNLQNITVWFGYVWNAITRILSPFKTLINDLFGFTSSSDAATTALSWLQGAFTGIAWILDLVATGVSTVINWFVGLPSPIKNIVYGLIAFKAAMWLVNLAMYANPVGLIVAGILALIAVIGLVVKYTNGWGKSWSGVVNGAKEVFNGYVAFVKANFNAMINGIMIGILKIQKGWYHFKNALGIGDSSKNQAMLDQIDNDVERRKQSIIDGYKKVAEHGKKAANEFSKIGITIDKEAIKKDFNKLKNSFTSATGKKEATGNYQKDVVDKYGAKTLNTNGGGSKDSATGGINGITGGGKKQTHLTINLEKLQDKTEIHTVNFDEGVEESESKLIEMLLRVLNSSNQVQTSLG